MVIDLESLGQLPSALSWQMVDVVLSWGFVQEQGNVFSEDRVCERFVRSLKVRVVTDMGRNSFRVASVLGGHRDVPQALDRLHSEIDHGRIDEGGVPADPYDNV